MALQSVNGSWGTSAMIWKHLGLPLVPHPQIGVCLEVHYCLSMGKPRIKLVKII